MSSAANTPLIKVMLVEDHLAFRQALAYLLSDHPELEVAAQAASVAEAREVLDGGDLDGGLDVAVLDLTLPDGDGRDLIGDLRRSSPGIRIMVLSATASWVCPHPSQTPSPKRYGGRYGRRTSGDFVANLREGGVYGALERPKPSEE